MYEGITMSDGTPLITMDQQCTAPIKLGYQIVHEITGRMLPMTLRNQVYTAWAAAEKLGNVALSIPTLNAMDYIMKPLYEHERPNQCTFIKSVLED